MRPLDRQLALALALALTVTASAPAAAERLERAGLVALGKTAMTTLGDEVYNDGGGTYEGWVLTGGGELRVLGMPTLSGKTGMQLRGDIAFVSPGAIIRDDKNLRQTPVGPRLALVTAEVGGGPLFDLYRSEQHHLSIAPEAFVGLDRRGFALQAELKIPLLLVRFTLRSGATWNGSQVREEELRVAYAHKDGWELGVLATHGFAEDEMQRADLKAVNKGGYTQTQLYLRFRSRTREHR